MARLLALAAFMLNGKWRRDAVPVEPADGLVAVHREWSNRTRHVWQEASGKSVTILLVGRSLRRPGVSELKRQLESQGIDVGGFQFVCPQRSLSGVRGIFNGWRDSGGASRALRKIAKSSGARPDFATLVSVYFRLMLGAEYRAWCNTHSLCQRFCLFGHTGMGDTGRLDHALKQQGVETVHWLHGMCVGGNFFAYSTVAVCRNEFDRQLLERLGGYERVVVNPAGRPSTAEGGVGWAILTSWLHPHSAVYQEAGVGGELSLLRMIAEAASGMEQCVPRLVWKPHPVFERLPIEEQSAVRQEVSRLGMTEWPKSQPLNRIKEFEIAIATESTVVLDVLREGVLPLVARPTGSGDGTFGSALPEELLFESSEGIVAASNRIRDDAFRRILFNKAWESMRPDSGCLPDEFRLSVAPG